MYSRASTSRGNERKEVGSNKRAASSNHLVAPLNRPAVPSKSVAPKSYSAASRNHVALDGKPKPKLLGASSSSDIATPVDAFDCKHDGGFAQKYHYFMYIPRTGERIFACNKCGNVFGEVGELKGMGGLDRDSYYVYVNAERPLYKEEYKACLLDETEVDAEVVRGSRLCGPVVPFYPSKYSGPT